MGNSLQDYRSRIGLFGGSSYSFKSRSNQYSGPRNKPEHLNINPRLILILILLCSVFYQATNQNSTNHETNKNYSNDRKNTELYRNLSPQTYQYLSRSPHITDFNFLARYTNGNGRKRNGLKMAHINLGGGFLTNRRNEIEHIIEDYKPHVLGISETRFEHNHCLQDVNIENYDLYFCKTLQNPILKTSRCAVYVHKDIVVKERPDLMNERFSSVWLELGLPKQKKFWLQISTVNGNIYIKVMTMHP